MYSANHSLALEFTLPITGWLEDETLFSLCSRFHYISGNAVASTSTRQLFSHPRHGAQHDFASNINIFVQRTRGTFGASARDIICKHTILPYYLPWRTKLQAQSIVQQLSAGRAGNVKSLLGLPSSRIRANHPLKACPTCIQADKQRFGVSYWHLTHQLPGVWICPTHACGLMEFINKATGVGRFRWYLPHEDCFYPPTWNLAPNEWLQRLTDVAIATFCLQPGTYIEHGKLVTAYRDALKKRALLRGTGQIALDQASYQYFQFTQTLNLPSPDIPLPATQAQARQHLTRLLAVAYHPTHPVRHMLIILWLFGNWERFWHAYIHAEPYNLSTAAKPTRPTDPSHPHNDPRKVRLLSLIQNEGLTISAAARRIGVAVQTAQSWANAQGIQVNRRSKTSRQNIQAILTDLRRGKDKAAIAARYGVSTQTVSRLLKTDADLLAQWKQAHHTTLVLAARRTWQRTLAHYPQAILKDLRALQPGCYTWLYRHDRLWLTESLAYVPKNQRRPTGCVDWLQRDRQLVAIVSATVQKIRSTNDEADITLLKIHQTTPQIKPHLKNLLRLPLTRQLLEQVCHRSLSPGSTTSR